MPRSLSDIFKDALFNLQEIVRLEISLAKVELRAEFAQVRIVAFLLGAGVVAVMLAVVFGLLAILDVLARAMPHWAAALLIAILLAVLAGALIALGRRRLKELPGRSLTVESLKKDMSWAKPPTV